MKVLITGTAGFIGNQLALEYLEAGHAVLGIDNYVPYYEVSLKKARRARLAGFERFSEIIADITDENIIELAAKFAPDIIVHLAAQAGVRYSLENPRAYVSANIVGSFNILELARSCKISHLVLASTSSAYGARTDVPFHENDAAARPLTIYAASKLSAEMMAHSHAHLYEIPTTALRFFTVYGPWGRPDMAPFLFTDAIANDHPITIFNHGDMARDFTYITDLTKAIRLLAGVPPIMGQPVSQADSLSPAAPYRLVNIGNAQPVALMDFISAIERALGKSAKKKMQDMQPGDMARTFAGTELLRALTGFAPATQIDDGISAYTRWYQSYYKP